MEKEKEYLAKNKGKAFEILKSKNKLNVFVDIYNNLCTYCKIKVKRKPNMTMKEYCDKCQKMAKEKFISDYK